MNAIELRELNKSFRLDLKVGRRQALNALSLTVKPEIYGFLGPNGAGKTTSSEILVLALRPDSGTATIFGLDPCAERDPPADRLPARVAGLLRPADRPGVPAFLREAVRHARARPGARRRGCWRRWVSATPEISRSAATPRA